VSYRWAVLAAGTVAQASFSTVSFAIAVLAPALREEYDLSLTEIGVVLAAEWIGLTFALLPWGFAVDRWGERWTLAGGLAACSLFLVGAAFAPSFGWLVVLLGLAGSRAAASSPAAAGR
jgi:sugar phosphate permease